MPAKRERMRASDFRQFSTKLKLNFHKSAVTPQVIYDHMH